MTNYPAALMVTPDLGHQSLFVSLFSIRFYLAKCHYFNKIIYEKFREVRCVVLEWHSSAYGYSQVHTTKLLPYQLQTLPRTQLHMYRPQQDQTFDMDTVKSNCVRYEIKSRIHSGTAVTIQFRIICYIKRQTS
jgi:hypothetical protein